MTYLIYGPPGSGKTTFAKDGMVDGDIIIDFDLLNEAITGMDGHAREYSLFERVQDVKDYLIETIDDFAEVRHTWIVSTAMPVIFKAAWPVIDKAILMPTPERECIRRCIARGGDPEHWKAIVKKWFKNNTNQKGA